MSSTNRLLAERLEPRRLLSTANFAPVGDLPGGQFMSNVRAVTDGGLAVGVSVASLAGGQGFQWTRAGGIAGLGYVPGGDYSLASDVSADGSVIVGYGKTPGYSGPLALQALRWTSAGVIGLGDFPGGGTTSEAHGVSGDGNVIVGNGATVEGMRAFRWTESTGMQDLGILPGYAQSRAQAASGDGSVVVGSLISPDPGQTREAFRWTAAGMQGIGHLAGFEDSSEARDVSGDGSVVVGWSVHRDVLNQAETYRAFRWTEAGGMMDLGTGAGHLQSVLNGVSADGSVAVGHTGSNAAPIAAIWTSMSGWRSIQSLLTGAGVSVGAWELWDALSISPDGRTVAGYGRNPTGQMEGWVATLPLIDVVTEFHFQTRQALLFTFNQPLASLNASALSVINLTTGASIAASNFIMELDGDTATFTHTAGILADGNYIATLPAGSVTAVGGASNTADVTLSYFVLAGDANRDRNVDLADAGILRTHFGGAEKAFGQGDFNYDTKVDLADFGILRGNFGTFLPPPGDGGLFGDDGEDDSRRW